MKFGFIGLGRMGKNMVLHQLEEGNQVVAYNRSPQPREELKKEASNLKKGKENLVLVSSLKEVVENLGAPRVIWLMISAGSAVDAVIDELIPLLDKGDLIIDGGNSFYTDTLTRAKKLKTKGINFMDVGTS